MDDSLFSEIKIIEATKVPEIVVAKGAAAEVAGIDIERSIVSAEVVVSAQIVTVRINAEVSDVKALGHVQVAQVQIPIEVDVEIVRDVKIVQVDVHIVLPEVVGVDFSEVGGDVVPFRIGNEVTQVRSRLVPVFFVSRVDLLPVGFAESAQILESTSKVALIQFWNLRVAEPAFKLIVVLVFACIKGVRPLCFVFGLW